MRRLSLFVLALTLVASPARAATPEETAKAREHFEKGRVHFDLKEYEPALREFKDGYRIIQDAVFLYNIAQCHYRMGQGREALDFYRNYLRRAPDATNRVEVEKRIAELETELARPPPPRSASRPESPKAPGARPPSMTAPPPPPVPVAIDGERAPPDDGPREARPIYKKWWFWTGMGALVLGALAIGAAGAAGGESGTCAVEPCIRIGP